MSGVESAKRAAAYQAVADHLQPTHQFVGIGSGSTVVYVVEAIAAKGPSFYANMLFFPTGSQSVGLITKAGLRLCHIQDRPADPATGKPVFLDVAFDGADEVDEDLNCIKGGGACLFLEKVVAVAAKRFVVVADYRKLSPRLLTNWKAIPIEVHPMAAPDVLATLRTMGSPNPTVRSGLPFKAGEGVTDNGHWEVEALAKAIKALTGVLEVGLFWGINGIEATANGQLGTAQKPVIAYFGMQDGSVSTRKPVN